MGLPDVDTYTSVFSNHLDKLIKSAEEFGILSSLEIAKIREKRDEIIEDFRAFISRRSFKNYREAVEAFVEYYKDILPSVHDLFYIYLHPETIVEKAEERRISGLEDIKEIIRETIREVLAPVYPPITAPEEEEIVADISEVERIIDIMERILYGTAEYRAREFHEEIHGKPEDLPELPKDIEDMCCPVPPGAFREGFLTSHVVIDMIKRRPYMVGIDLVARGKRFFSAPEFSAWVYGKLMNIMDSDYLRSILNIYGRRVSVEGKVYIDFAPKADVDYGILIYYPSMQYAYVFFTPLRREDIDLLKDQRRIHAEYIEKKVREKIRRNLRRWTEPFDISALQVYLISKIVAQELWRMMRGGLP